MRGFWFVVDVEMRAQYCQRELDLIRKMKIPDKGVATTIPKPSYGSFNISSALDFTGSSAESLSVYLRKRYKGHLELVTIG